MFTTEQIQSLNELEFEVYKYIIANIHSIQQMRIRELADKVHVSTSTILRFCKKVNCEGYSELKLTIKHHLATKKHIFQNNQKEVILNYFDTLNVEYFNQSITQIAQLILQSDKTLFCGIGFSGALAKYGVRWMTSLGKLAYHMEEAYLEMLIHEDKTVAIILSVSGETAQVIEMANRFKSQGITLIALTTSSVSTLANLSDYVITYPIPIDYIPNTSINITTQVPVLFILEQLARKVHELQHSDTKS